MSNCISFVFGTQVQEFTRQQIDVEAVLTRCEEIQQEHGNKCPDDGSDSTWWWYLSQNIQRTGHGLVIDFSGGRSSHSHRSFRATLLQLVPYMRCVRILRLKVTDEYDGHTKWFVYDYRVGPNGVVEESNWAAP